MRGDGDVVDVDVLLADEVEQQIKRTVVDLTHGDAVGGEAFGSIAPFGPVAESLEDAFLRS